jgi:hypothetical protein
MSSNPDQIKADIEATRVELSRDVDALAQTVSPANVAARQKEKVASAVTGVKDRATTTIFGAKDTVMGKAEQVQSASGDAFQNSGEAITSAPQMVKQGAQGNPLAAGMIALGIGWLAGSLLPATRAERQAASTLKEKAAPLVQDVSDMAKESAQGLQVPAKDAAEQIKSAGADALQTVKEEGTTTTPFDMVVLNDLDRFHLVMDAADRVPALAGAAAYIKRRMREKRIAHKAYIVRHGEDMPEIRNWKWPYGSG